MPADLTPYPSPTGEGSPKPSYLPKGARTATQIRWLVQTTEACPDLELGIAPTELLTPAEAAQFGALKIPKRRHDWLLGRWTARRLLRAALPDSEAYSVLAGPDGAPVLTAANGYTHPSISLSISHSHDRAFCALVNAPGWTIGADVERIEPHTSGFISDFFTEAEQAQIRRAPAMARTRLVVAMWSAKEAALKALHLGLTVDTRSLSCLIDPIHKADGWAHFEIVWHTAPAPSLVGWWHTAGDFVLSLVARRLD